MIHVPITLRENTSTDRILEPTRVSVPFASGTLFNPDDLLLVNDLQASITFQSQALAFWPDHSIKWLMVHFQPSINASSHCEYYLTSRTHLHVSALEHQYDITLEEASDRININTGVAAFTLFKDEYGLIGRKHDHNNTSFASENNSVVLTDSSANRYRPMINEISINETGSTDLQQSVKLCGSFQKQNTAESSDTSPINFEAHITFFAGKSFTQNSFTIHNPQSMVHDGGKWDLGNENSFFFDSLELQLQLNSITDICYQTTRDEACESTNTQPFAITQVSSGGKNWQSNNHMNQHGEVLLPFQGYRVAHGDNEDEIAGRASPLIGTCSKENNISVYIENFWQNFPSRLQISKNRLSLGLFPPLSHETYELQPGEKKTHTFFIDYLANSHETPIARLSESPIQTSLCPKYVASTQAISLFSDNQQDAPLNTIINEGLHSEHNFFNKREVIDEFGWRNFGDIYADHEALSYKGDGELISHYNNQYDPLYGFLRQYLLTGEKQWLTLANDLANHVTDIDIYHTKVDRDEYNGGLFWHTDHYLSAETASHRTYSKRQSANAYQDHAGGGGPGGQHCYTTGLMLHYFLTGKESSKAAALTIGHWVTNVYEGSSTLGDFLLAVKNKNRNDLKNIFTGKYPLDRGTGNYIVALLDSFELTGKQSFIDNASLVIKNTVHPDEDIALRDLMNVEECWFYTVFLQAVGRFLLLKESHEQFDESFQYARNVLLHYSQWMSNNETPYLDKPEILEYPNHTWAAQDIRKANVFYTASHFATNKAQQALFYKKGDHFYDYVTRTLEAEPTKYFSRILSILMQNHGAKSFCADSINNHKIIPENKAKVFLIEEKSPLKSLLNAFLNTLSNTSLALELSWLRKRVTKVDDFLIRLGR